jgi:hypothetical protein
MTIRSKLNLEIMDDKKLRKNLLELLTGESAHVNFENTIKNVPAGMRGKNLSDNVHSIWQEVEHIRIANEDLINYSLNADWKSPEWPKEYWPEPKENISDEEWNHSINAIRKSYKDVKNLINDETVDLTAEIPHGEGRTYLRQILLIADHTSYHLAQIVQTRKLLGIWSGGL